MPGVGVLCINFLKIILFWYTDFFFLQRLTISVTRFMVKGNHEY